MIHREAWHQELIEKQSDTVQYPKNMWDRDPALQQRILDFMGRDFLHFPHEIQLLLGDIRAHGGEGAYPELRSLYNDAQEKWKEWRALTREGFAKQNTEEIMALEESLQKFLQVFQEMAQEVDPVKKPPTSGPAYQYPKEEFKKYPWVPRELEKVNQLYGRMSASHTLGMLHVLKKKLGPVVELEGLETRVKSLFARWAEIIRGASSDMVEQSEIHTIEKELNSVELFVQKIYNSVGEGAR